MKNLFFVLFMLTAIAGCALPTIGEDLDSYLKTKFTNPIYPNSNPVKKNRYVWSLTKGENIYYKKEPEGINTRYYIDWGVKDCRYSLLVSPGDIILSWRDEGGETHVSKCTYS
jgi:hypothetical protein